MSEMNALTPTNNNLVVFYSPGMTSLFQAFVLQKLQKRGEKRLRYSKQNYFRLPPFGIKLCTKACEKKKKKRNEAKQCFVCFTKW